MDTLSSLSTERDNSFKDSASSFVNLNSKRAAILKARKMRAANSELVSVRQKCYDIHENMEIKFQIYTSLT